VPRYLVTGGAGFIGSHIAARLLGTGETVRVIDNMSTGRRENLEAIRAEDSNRRFDWMEGDITSLETCRRACEGVDFVIHQAALASVQRSIERPAESTAVNVGGTVNLLTAAREGGVSRFVLASSSSVYGDTPTLPKHEGMPTAPLSPYAVSKLAGEEFVRVFAATLGLSAVSLRYFNVFGPRQDPNSHYAAVVPRFITALLRGERPTVYGDGLQSRDFTYVENVVQANLNACRLEGFRGEVINVACGDRFTLLELLRHIGEIVGVDPRPVFEPPRGGDVRDSMADVARARQMLAFVPTIGFREGLERTVSHFRNAG
jgi:nucleoside-diphosphate-sugar epimerase